MGDKRRQTNHKRHRHCRFHRQTDNVAYLGQYFFRAVRQNFSVQKEVPSIISTAKNYLGVPYVFGGASPEEGFDCSGFLEYVFARNGIEIPRTADEQYRLGKLVRQSQLVAGDLVFFTTYEPGASHCGIYLGNDKFIHASSSKGIRVDDINDSYWASRYYGGKHIVK